MAAAACPGCLGTAWVPNPAPRPTLPPGDRRRAGWAEYVPCPDCADVRTIEAREHAAADPTRLAAAIGLPAKAAA